MGTVLLDTHGRLAWCSPQATSWLTQGHGTLQSPGNAAATWLTRARSEGEAQCALSAQQTLVARHMGQGGLGESMILLTTVSRDKQTSSRLQQVALTPRETEVLSWLAKGKTNRDIADILGMSHRTVNKHLEHVFEKLGVETRTAAAALALQRVG